MSSTILIKSGLASNVGTATFSNKEIFFSYLYPTQNINENIKLYINWQGVNYMINPYTRITEIITDLDSAGPNNGPYYVRISGDTMTGPLILSQFATHNMGAVPLAQLNQMIAGGMRYIGAFSGNKTIATNINDCYTAELFPDNKLKKGDLFVVNIADTGETNETGLITPSNQRIDVGDMLIYNGNDVDVANSTEVNAVVAADFDVIDNTELTSGMLITNLSTAQTPSAGESFNGNIKLHKISKTGNYSDLIGVPTIPTVNDGQLVIKKNGTTITATGGTFTANKGSNSTYNITIGTGKLNLTQNGVSINPTTPFHADSSSDVTYNIVAPDWNAASNEAGYILNKPIIPSFTGTLITTATSLSKITTAISLNTDISLHDIARTGKYSDLSSKAIILFKNNSNAEVGTGIVVQSQGDTFNASIALHETALSGNYSKLNNLPILNTIHTTSQTPNESETIVGTINLHKLAKTGHWNDIIGKPSDIPDVGDIPAPCDTTPTIVGGNFGNATPGQWDNTATPGPGISNDYARCDHRHELETAAFNKKGGVRLGTMVGTVQQFTVDNNANLKINIIDGGTF